MNMTPPVQERRRRARVGLRCPLRAFRHVESAPLHGRTFNLSSEGLFWLSEESITPGERLHCSILIAPHGFRCGAVTLSLECRVQVVWVERLDREYGVGCRIEQYVLTTDAGVLDLSCQT